MKWYDYVTVFITADIIFASIISFNFLTLALGIAYWFFYENMRKTGKL